MGATRIGFIWFLLLPVAAPVHAQTEGDLAGSLVRREEAALRQAAAAVAPSVVQIRTIGGLEKVEQALIAEGPTTGLIISPDGYILSSSFNFVQRPASILVTFPSGKRAPADIVATDHSRMLVLLKAHDVEDLPVPESAPLADIQVGQWAIAIGRAFRADVPNVSVGIVSATNRITGRAIQTDAAVSMANYGGPLVDVQGRVLGILVPMSAQEGDVAGIEWYDSGIGFAVPLTAITARIEEMKQGNDQYPGRLGVSLKMGNPFTLPVELVAVRPNSPAGKVGLKKGDRIVAVDGKNVETQQDLRLVLGPRYAGETLTIEVLRGKERFERELTLVGELEVFRHASLGILPERFKPENEKENDKNPREVRVRAVVPGSPAESAGIRRGDTIALINNEPVTSVVDAIERMNAVAVGDPVAVRIRRGLRVLDLTVSAGPWAPVPEDLELPKWPKAPDDASDDDTADLKPEKLQLPEFAHQCEIYSPAGADGDNPLGLLIIFQEPGNIAAKELIAEWKPVCDERGILLAVAAPEKNQPWQAGDYEFFRRLLLRLRASHPVDDQRIVVVGQGHSGDFAYQAAFAARGLVDGVAVASAALPYWLNVPQNEPSVRLAVFSTLEESDGGAVQLGIEKLMEAGYPVTSAAPGDDGGLPPDQFARWIDTLDCF